MSIRRVRNWNVRWSIKNHIGWRHAQKQSFQGYSGTVCRTGLVDAGRADFAHRRQRRDYREEHLPTARTRGDPTDDRDIRSQLRLCDH